MKNIQLGLNSVLRDKQNDDGKDLSGMTQVIIESGKTGVSDLLKEGVSQVLEKILNGTYELQKNNDKYNQREVNKLTGEYIHTFLVSNGNILKVIYQYHTMKSIKIEYQGEMKELSGEKYDYLKGKLKKIYTSPAFHSNPDGTPRGAWI